MTDLFTIVKLFMLRQFLLFRTGEGYLTCGSLGLFFWATILASGNSLSITSQESEPQLLKELQAECNPQGIQVKLWFKKPFAGIAYSNGHYETTKCRYISHEGGDADTDHVNKAMESSGTNFSFLIPMNECGTVYYEGDSSGKHQNDTRRNTSNEYEVYIENTLLIQSDPAIHLAEDVAKTLRCVWQKQIRQPLMASLPIGNGKMTSSKLYGGVAQRVKTITATMHKSRPIHENKGSLLLGSNSNQTSIPRLNLRFQKKGQVQSVPFAERRHHSRAMDMDDASLENSSNPNIKNEEKRSDQVSALPLQTQSKNVGSVAAQKNTRFIFFVTLMMFSIPARI